MSGVIFFKVCDSYVNGKSALQLCLYVIWHLASTQSSSSIKNICQSHLEQRKFDAPTDRPECRKKGGEAVAAQCLSGVESL